MERKSNANLASINFDELGDNSNQDGTTDAKSSS